MADLPPRAFRLDEGDDTADLLIRAVTAWNEVIGDALFGYVHDLRASRGEGWGWYHRAQGELEQLQEMQEEQNG